MLIAPSAPEQILRAALVPLALALLAWPGAADQGHGHAEPQELGVVDFPISCSELAQEQFNRAVSLLHHMTYPQAKAAFERVAETDPECAMAHWGIAMTLFQPTWPTRPSPDDLERGWEAAQTAIEIGSPSELENLFVATAEAFFFEPTSTDYWLRVHRWEAAMEAVHTAFPESHDAAAFYALAHLAVAPADQASHENSNRAADLLLEVYRQNPEHPGAMHYMIHANDAPGRERKLLEVVRKYESVAPNNPHALHMPTHIYTRLGDWDGVIRGNLRAAAAALLHPAGDRGELVSDEFPHAIEYLVYAYLQQGADDKAAAELQRMLDTEMMQPSFKTAFHLASTQARYALERRAWDEAAALVPRCASGLDWDRFRWPEAISWFARGLGSVQLGRVDEARRATARLGELEMSARAAGESLFARNIRILALEMDAWIAHGGGEFDSAVELMRQAVELEASTPKHAVTPGPTLPALEQLGDLLLEQGRAKDSLAAYEEALKHYPGRMNSLFGAARAARAHEDPTKAAAYYQALLEGSVGGARSTLVKEAREYVPAVMTEPSLEDIEANHRAFFPDTGAPFATVVAIPGCSGVSLDGPATDEGRPGDEADRLFRRHYAKMAERLRDNGLGVILVDYLTSENIANTCSGEIPHERVGEYIATSLDFARTLPQVDPSRLYVVGWSHGGAGVIAWLQALEEEAPPAVAGAVAVYPGCNSRDVWASAVPVLVLLGDADDITPPESCAPILLSLPEGTELQVRRYADARHGFDFTEGPEVLSIGGGMTVGRNPSAGEEAWKEIFAFLGRE